MFCTVTALEAMRSHIMLSGGTVSFSMFPVVSIELMLLEIMINGDLKAMLSEQVLEDLLSRTGL